MLICENCFNTLKVLHDRFIHKINEKAAILQLQGLCGPHIIAHSMLRVNVRMYHYLLSQEVHKRKVLNICIYTK